MRDIPADGDVPGTRGLSFVRRNRILCVSCVGKSGTLSALNENVRKGEKQDSDGNSGGGDARRLPVVQGEDFGPPGRADARQVYIEQLSAGGKAPLIDSVSLDDAGNYRFELKNVPSTPSLYTISYNGESVPC